MKNSAGIFYKKAFLVFNGLLLCLSMNAQQPTVPFITDKSCGIECLLNKSFNEGNKKIDGCGAGMCFVKFLVTTEGWVNNIEFNEGTPGFMQSFLKESLRATNGKWTVSKLNATPIESPVILLPIDYALEKCKTSRDTVLFINNDIYTASPIPGLDDTLNKRNLYSFIHMLDFAPLADNQVKSTLFGGGDYQPLSCIVFSTILLRRKFAEDCFPMR